MNVPAEPIPIEELLRASRRPEIAAAVQSLYQELDRRIAAHKPTCVNRGFCCDFGRWGHRLYVTALEVCCWLAAGEPPPPIAQERCPYALVGRCAIRDRRPLGCRIFFCDPASRDWQGPLTEEFMTRLRALHEQSGVPYVYADWLTILDTFNNFFSQRS